MNLRKTATVAAAFAVTLGSLTAASVFGLGTSGTFEARAQADPVNLVLNGSFEVGTVFGPDTIVFAGDPNIENWSVVAGSVDYLDGYWTASEGTRSIDLSGFEEGSISQSFSTTVGHTYQVTFDMAGNTDGQPPEPIIKTLEANVGGEPIPFAFDITGHDGVNMGWEQRTFNFTATASTITLTFVSTTPGLFGPALDNVVVEDITPEDTPTPTPTLTSTPTSTLTPTPTSTPSPTPTSTPALTTPTDKDQCKDGGWRTFNNPAFKNQGDCVSFVQSNEHAEGNKTK